MTSLAGCMQPHAHVSVALPGVGVDRLADQFLRAVVEDVSQAVMRQRLRDVCRPDADARRRVDGFNTKDAVPFLDKIWDVALKSSFLVALPFPFQIDYSPDLSSLRLRPCPIERPLFGLPLPHRLDR